MPLREREEDQTTSVNPAEVLDHQGTTKEVALPEQFGDWANLAYFLEGLTVVTSARGEAVRSARLSGASEGLLEAVGATVYNYFQPDQSHYEHTISAKRSRLDEAAFEAARAEGRS